MSAGDRIRAGGPFCPSSWSGRFCVPAGHRDSGRCSCVLHPNHEGRCLCACGTSPPAFAPLEVVHRG